MDFQAIVFYFFSAVLIAAAIGVVTARNPVHSALLLVLAFFSSAGLWLQLQAEFLAIVLVLVYVGAVMVLFLFVVMMLDINVARLREGFWRHIWLGGAVGGLLVVEMYFSLRGRNLEAGDVPEPAPLPPEYSNTRELGRLVYTEYVYALEIAAVILLVAIVAAIALTLRQRKKTKYRDPAQQVQVRREDRIRIVSMRAERPDRGEEKGERSAS